METFKLVIIAKIREVDVHILILLLFVLCMFSFLFLSLNHGDRVTTERFSMCIEKNPIESCKFILGE
jgi:hypothetical protein